jgi:protein-tyrosine-phosphatase
MPPPYFFKLAEKIKMMGDDVTATTDRTIAKSLKSKDGKSEYLLEEDLATGDTSIKKIYKEDDNMITDVEIMELKKGEVVQTKDGKAIKTPDEYEEVTESNSRIYKDEFNDPDYTDGINVDEIIKEVDDKIPSIKYAQGGLAYMLGE